MSKCTRDYSALCLFSCILSLYFWETDYMLNLTLSQYKLQMVNTWTILKALINIQFCQSVNGVKSYNANWKYGVLLSVLCYHISLTIYMYTNGKHWRNRGTSMLGYIADLNNFVWFKKKLSSFLLFHVCKSIQKNIWMLHIPPLSHHRLSPFWRSSTLRSSLVRGRPSSI